MMTRFLTASLAGLILLGLGAAPAQAGKGDKGDKKRDPEAIFKKLDANADGHLTLAELNRKGKKDPETIKAKFAKLDKNSDEQVTLAELKARGKKKADGKSKTKSKSKGKKKAAKSPTA